MQNNSNALKAEAFRPIRETTSIRHISREVLLQPLGPESLALSQTPADSGVFKNFLKWRGEGRKTMCHLSQTHVMYKTNFCTGKGDLLKNSQDNRGGGSRPSPLNPPLPRGSASHGVPVYLAAYNSTNVYSLDSDASA